MGVHGLSSFVQENEKLFDMDHRLNNTHLIIDGFNLMNVLAQDSKNGERTDLFGGDMVAFGATVNRFYDNLELCKITPILVMDGAQTFEINKSKVGEKLSRSRERFGNVMKINENGFGRFVFPTTANILFKSVAIDRRIKIYQSFYEADLEVARLAIEYKCPVISEDSDFYLIDLPQGVVPTNSLEWKKPKSSKQPAADRDTTWRNVTPKCESAEYFYIRCKLYKHDNFKYYLPGLDTKCLPLVGPLLGNDFVSTDTYSSIVYNLPSKLIEKFPNPFMKRQLKANSQQHQKIIRVLCFFVHKTPEQVINQLSTNLPNDKRPAFKKILKSAMDVYFPPLEDTYRKELMKVFEAGFKATYANRIPDAKQLNAKCDKAIEALAGWLIRCAEQSVMTHKVLELLNKNVIFIKPSMDDITLPSAQTCRYRVYAVIIRLLRASPASKKPLEIYNRCGLSYEKILIQQVHIMDEFGPIKYIAYDLPTLSADIRRDLVLATFHHNHQRFIKGLLDCDIWFDPKHGDEFMTVWMIMDYIDIECPEAKLTKHFRQATLLCLVYYLCIRQPDRNFDHRMEQLRNNEFVSGLIEAINARYMCNTPVLGKTRNFGNRNYDCRIMHQLLQLHASIEGFNLINALLGDPLTRVRAEYWLNSCLIYNLTEALRKNLMRVSRMPDIIACAMSPLSQMEQQQKKQPQSNRPTKSHHSAPSSSTRTKAKMVQ